MAQHNLHFVALLGSLRRESLCRAIANTMDEIAPEEVHVSVLDTIGQLPHFNDDVRVIAIPEQVRDMAVMLGEADAVIIVTPEYNFSIPGVLKNALDWLSRIPQRPLADKPVAIQTASTGMFGGIRAQYHLRQVLLSLDAIVLSKPEIIIPYVEERVDRATQTLRDEDTRRHVTAQLQALMQLTCARREHAPT